MRRLQVGLVVCLVGLVAACSGASPSEPATLTPPAVAPAPTPSPMAVEQVEEGAVIPILPKPASPDMPTLNTVDAETIAALPVDPDPFGEITGIRATINTRVPVYAEPGGEAVGWLDPVTVTSPTVFPVFEVLEGDPDWLLVPVALTRAGLPSAGVTGQVVAWVWEDTFSDEITLAYGQLQIEVDLSDRSLTVRDLSRGRPSWRSATSALGQPRRPHRPVALS